MEYMRIAREHLGAVMALFEQEGWPCFVTDPQRTWRALSAQGVRTVVAVEDGQVVGLAQLLTDGEIGA
jgi:hypothetical protein